MLVDTKTCYGILKILKYNQLANGIKSRETKKAEKNGQGKSNDLIFA
jgi:hypothetical protein